MDNAMDSKDLRPMIAGLYRKEETADVLCLTASCGGYVIPSLSQWKEDFHDA